MKIGYSYHGNTFFEHFKEDVAEMKRAGASYLVQTFSENKMEFNRDNMRRMNKYAREEGLEVHIDPWGVAGIFGGEAYTKFVAEHPGTMQQNNQGELLPMACLNHPKTRAFLKEWIDTVSELEVDYIFWDEPHFFIQVDPESPIWGCRCEQCQKKYRDKYGEEMPVKGSERIEEFKRDSIKEFLAEMLDYSTGKGLKNGLCVLPPPKGESFEDYWRQLLTSLPLDYFGTDPYWLGWNRTIDEMVIPQVELIKKLCAEAGVESQIWLQGFKVEEEKLKEWEEGLDTLLDSSVDLLGVWSYKCCNSCSFLDFGTSQRCWEIIKEKVSDRDE